jgi:hypothetical protein
MSFQINGQTTGIFASDVSCNTLDISNVINNSLKSSLFFNALNNSSTGYVLVGQNVKQSVGVSYLSLTTLMDYPGLYCEFILSGSHNLNSGFSIKYEFCITNNPGTNVITQGGTGLQVTSGSAITGITIGTEVATLPTIVQSTNLKVTTFTVNCAQTTNVSYVLFYRIMGRQLSVQNL